MINHSNNYSVQKKFAKIRKKRVKFGCIAETFGISGKAMIDNGLHLLKTKGLLEKLQKANPIQFMTLKFRISGLVNL